MLCRKEQGLTLIEVLITLSILSIIGTIIWSVFFQGIQFSQKSSSKNFLIQETNIIISNLKNIHQTADSYGISSSTPCEFSISKNGNPAIHFSQPKVCYEYSISKVIPNNPSTPVDINNIDPTKYNVHIKITTSEYNNRSNKVTVDTILYRLKEGSI